MHGARVASVATLVVLLGACGGSSKSSTSSSHPAQPTPNGSFVPGELSSLPTLGQMKALGPEQHSDGVTTRSYGVTGYGPQDALTTYAKQLNGWSNSIRPHAVGSSWRGTWTRDQYSLVVTAIKAPTLSAGGGSDELQMTLQLYAPGVTPPTERPYG